MHRLILWQVFIIYFLFISPVNTFASDIVINEIFANPEDEEDEFIEIYNKSENEIDLNNWKIVDLVRSYTISDEKISGNSFMVFEKKNLEDFSITLNNSNEEVSLIDQEDNKVDTFSYDDTIEGKSWSRVPDGSGNFENNTDVTKGSQNSSPPTPTPTKPPTSIPTNRPTKAPTSTNTPTTGKIGGNTNDMTISPNQRGISSNNNNSVGLISTPSDSKNIKGVSEETEKDSEELSEDNSNSTPNYVYSLTTGIGMMGLACGILLYRKFKERNEEDDF